MQGNDDFSGYNMYRENYWEPTLSSYWQFSDPGGVLGELNMKSEDYVPRRMPNYIADWFDGSVVVENYPIECTGE